MSQGSPRMVTTASEHAELADRMAVLRGRFQTCLGELHVQGGTADALSAAMLRTLAAVRPAELPLAARTIWRERVARPLKADGMKPLPPKAFGLVRSWPTSRVNNLLTALSEIEALLAEAENDARNEVIYAEISRAYS